MEYELIAALRLFLAALLGGLIGLERESLNKAAGLRTHTLVSLGSCLIMLTSIEIFENVGHGTIGDPARIAAQVVSGIGFLGAGTILRSGFDIKGLTTAASLWVVASIGLAVGIGSYFAAIVTTTIVFLILVYMPRIENKVKAAQKKMKIIKLTINDLPGQLGLITSLFGELNMDIRNVEMSETQNKEVVEFTFLVVLPYNLNETEILKNLNKIKGINQISFS
jgi:putative Mg2+ transporter-C (MgtC) family protein